MKKKEGNFITYAEKRFSIHGKLENTVFRRKRNGENYSYPYKHIPKYDPTILSKRTNAIARIAAQVSNPRHADYSEKIVKIYYYTPYFVYPGAYVFTCNTFYNIRTTGDYQIKINEVIINRRLAPRTKESFTFEDEGTYLISCWFDDKLWSERKVEVISPEINLEETYSNWFGEHLAEILALPEPGFKSLKKYHRNIIGIKRLKTMTGKVKKDLVIFKGAGDYTMHARKTVDHENNLQSRVFLETYSRILNCWQATTPKFNRTWKDYHKVWLNENIRRTQRTTNSLHLWTRAIHKAAANLSFDLETLSVEHWLPEVNTLGDLLQAAGFHHYFIDKEKLAVVIF